MGNFEDAFTQLQKDFDSAQTEKGTLPFHRLSTTLNRFDATMREFIQVETQDRINKIIDKLNKNGQLNSEELDLVRLWIVGDAEYYTKMENNFNDWMKELGRLVAQIEQKQGATLDAETALQLRGSLRDAISVMEDILYFLQQKERIERFEESTQELDSEEKRYLSRILSQKLRSQDY